MKRFAVFADNFEILTLADKIPTVEFYFFAGENSLTYKWASQFLPPEKLLTFKLNPGSDYLNNYGTEGVLRHSNLSEVIKRNQISYLIPTLVCTKYLNQWASKNKVTIVSSPYHLQDKLENKIIFDKFLTKNQLPKPKSWFFNYSQNKHLPQKGSFVLQKAVSTGAEGTFFIESESQIEKLIKQKKVKPKANYLLRELLTGRSFGITVFIEPGLIALSTARQQCFSDQDTTNRKIFLGVQWITNNFNGRLAEKINHVFWKIGEILSKKGFFGFANFDFLVDNDGNVHLIECNPRLSTATTQLVWYPSLISDLPVGKLFLEGFLKKRVFNQKITYYPYPQTNFNGAALNISVRPEESRREIIINQEYKNGLYSFTKNQLKFVNLDPRQRDNKQKQLFFYSNAKKGEIYKKKTTVVGYTFANYPLFGNKGRLNQNGQVVLDNFRY